MTVISCCNFPTTVLVLDDDEDFLESIQGVLSEKYKCICTSDAQRAREILINNRGWTESSLKKGITRTFSGEDLSLFSVSMNFPQFKDQIYDLNRFKHITVVVVDYDMPEKNGLEFIRHIEDSQLKIIMLTGKAEQRTVIKAFNEREIHRYVSKGDPDYLHTLLQYIKELQDEFFFDFSKSILESLKETETKIFDKKEFVELFHQTLRENEIAEYYLLEESGSFLLIDATGKNQFSLIIKSETDMQHLYELARSDSDTPAYVIKQLKDRKVFTHFKTKEESIAPARYWRLLDAQSLDENKEYYYALIKNDENFQINGITDSQPS
jgi:CheY-like chemotaxis protein